MKKIFLILILCIFAIPLVSALPDESWVFPGLFNYNYTGNSSFVTVQVVGGGGSGMGEKWIAGPWPLWGYGGSAGSQVTHTMVPVTLYTIYPIVVAPGGGRSNANTYSTVSLPGGSSSAFGYTSAGGLGGVAGSYASHVGGDGEYTGITDFTGTWGFTTAEAGGSVTEHAGGAAGSGYGAGGGGAADNLTLLNATYGGAGAQGIVNLWYLNYSGTNQPNYTASPLSAGVGSIITFLDQSTLNDINNISYLWNFGDGSTSTTKGTVTHVYSSYGVFSTNLSITSDTGTVYNYKQDYITITNVPITAWYQQKLVRLKVVDSYGGQLRGANITINYISNTLPSQDANWLTTAFGVSQTTALAMTNSSVAMQGWTDVDGASVFMMFPAIQYGITITNQTIGLSKYITLNPQDTDYIIQCILPSQTHNTTALTHLYNSTLYVTEPNASYITWNMYYQDTSGYTTDFTWYVVCLTNGTVMYNGNVYGGAYDYRIPIIDSYTFPSEPKGVEYKATYEATRSVP
jgi:PKD repeat protein